MGVDVRRKSRFKLKNRHCHRCGRPTKDLLSNKQYGLVCDGCDTQIELDKRIGKPKLEE